MQYIILYYNMCYIGCPCAYNCTGGDQTKLITTLFPNLIDNNCMYAHQYIYYMNSFHMHVDQFSIYEYQWIFKDWLLYFNFLVIGSDCCSVTAHNGIHNSHFPALYDGEHPQLAPPPCLSPSVAQHTNTPTAEQWYQDQGGREGRSLC